MSGMKLKALQDFAPVSPQEWAARIKKDIPSGSLEDIHFEDLDEFVALPFTHPQEKIDVNPPLLKNWKKGLGLVPLANEKETREILDQLLMLGPDQLHIRIPDNNSISLDHLTSDIDLSILPITIYDPHLPSSYSEGSVEPETNFCDLDSIHSVSDWADGIYRLLSHMSTETNAYSALHFKASQSFWKNVLLLQSLQHMMPSIQKAMKFINGMNIFWHTGLRLYADHGTQFIHQTNEAVSGIFGGADQVIAWPSLGSEEFGPLFQHRTAFNVLNVFGV